MAGPYQYRISACSSDASCGAVAVAEGLVVFMGLGKVTDLEVAAGGDSGNGEFSLNWSAVSVSDLVIRYILQECYADLCGDGADWSDISDNLENGPYVFSDPDPTANEKSRLGPASYVYRVRACIGADPNDADRHCGEWSDNSTAVNVRLGAPAIQASGAIPPEGTDRRHTSYSGLYTISWNELSHGWYTDFSYQLQEKLPGGSWPDNDGEGLQESEALSYTTPSAKTTAGDHEYRVRACGDRGCGLWSAPTVIVNVQKLGQVTGLQLQDGAAPDSGTFTIEWDALSEGVVAYRILAKGPGETEFSALGTAASASYDLGDPIPLVAGVYSYKAQACPVADCPDESNGPESSALEVTVANIPAVTDLRLTGGSAPTAEGAYSLSWTALDAPRGPHCHLQNRRDRGSFRSDSLPHRRGLLWERCRSGGGYGQSLQRA